MGFRKALVEAIGVVARCNQPNVDWKLQRPGAHAHIG